MPLFGNIQEVDSNAIKFSHREIEDTVTNYIKASLSNYELKDDYYKLVFSHSYHQVLMLLDELFEKDPVTSMNFILPEYKTREDGTLIIKKPLLKRYRVKKGKKPILELVRNICNTTVTNAVKGVNDYVNRKKRW